ncbi:hypothetical protein [Streptomyces sp. NPDC058665]
MLRHLLGDLLSYAGGELGDDMAMIAVAWGVPENPAGAARAPGRA